MCFFQSDDELTEEIQDDKSQLDSDGESQREEEEDEGDSKKGGKSSDADENVESSPVQPARRRKPRKAD